MSILLETKGLTKKYKNGIALNHVSIQVEKVQFMVCWVLTVPENPHY